MYPINYKPVVSSSFNPNYGTTVLGSSQMAFVSPIGVTFAAIQGRPSSDIYKPFSKIFWNLLTFYLRGGCDVREVNSGTPPYYTYDSNNKFVHINFDAGMGNSIFEITKEGENYLKLLRNTYQNNQISGSDLKMLLYLINVPVSPYGMEFYLLKCWEFLGIVNSQPVAHTSERGYLERAASLTERGYEAVRSNAENILKALKTDVDRSNSERVICESLIKIIKPDEWGGLLPLVDHKTASYISDLLFPTMHTGE